MSKTLKIICIVLAVLVLAGTVVLIVTCDNDENPNTVPTQPIGTINENEYPVPTNVLHKVNVTETSNVFVDDSGATPTTEYSILYAEDTNNQKMAAFVLSHVVKSTGASMDMRAVTSTDVYDATQKIIYVNCPTQFAQAGLTMPNDDIGTTGYYIKSVGNSVFIATKGPYGTQHAGISFLQHLIGYEMYGANAVVYKKSGATIPNYDVIERPDYDYYIASNKVDNDTMYGMGFQPNSDLFINIKSADSASNMWHNSLDYVPCETYRASHPKWFMEQSFYSESKKQRYDLCYTAHGDAVEYQALVDLVVEQMLYWINLNPTKPFITFTIEDHNLVCTCDACNASAAKYNGSNSAAVIQFLNIVNNRIQAQLQADAEENGVEKRQIGVLFFAYHKMLSPPAIKNADGTWSPIDETVVCGENLGVYLAPIEANYGYSFTEEQNQQFKDNSDGWAACADIIYMWTYNTNFKHYLYPCNSFDDMIDNYRYFKDLGAVYMWVQGQHNVGNSSHFTLFKDYVNSKALFDTSVNMKDLTDDYFANYFMDANQPMRQYFDELQAHLLYLQEEYSIAFRKVTHAEIANVLYWPESLLTQWSGYIADAYKAIEKYKTTNEVLYNQLYDRITIESLFIRYAQMSLHYGSFAESQLQEMRVQFKADCEKYGVTNIREWDTLNEEFTKWGLQ